MTSQAAAKSGLKQETIAIVAVGLTMPRHNAVHHEPARKPLKPKSSALKPESIALRPRSGLKLARTGSSLPARSCA